MVTRYNPPDEAGVFHFVTLKVRDCRRPFAKSEFVWMALDALRFECDRHPAELVAYVVMPDHIHFITWLNDGSLTKFLVRYKLAVTMQIDAYARENGLTKITSWLRLGESRELWQDGKHNVALWSGRMIRQKIAYIHNNPVYS